MYVYTFKLNRNKIMYFVINNLNVKLVQKNNNNRNHQSNLEMNFWFANYNDLDDRLFNMQSLRCRFWDPKDNKFGECRIELERFDYYHNHHYLHHRRNPCTPKNHHYK